MSSDRPTFSVWARWRGLWRLGGYGPRHRGAGGEVEGARPRAGGHAGCGRRTAMRLSSGPVDQLPRRPHAIRYPRGAVSASGGRPHVGLGGRSTASGILAGPFFGRAPALRHSNSGASFHDPPACPQWFRSAQVPPFPARRAGPLAGCLPFRASAALDVLRLGGSCPSRMWRRRARNTTPRPPLMFATFFSGIRPGR